ncbi:MAG: hypothetical protein KC457_29860, partial [Myxococcales bacterium]|nr:hypothetical protein [Myxococcales bacterium]
VDLARVAPSLAITALEANRKAQRAYYLVTAILFVLALLWFGVFDMDAPTGNTAESKDRTPAAADEAGDAPTPRDPNEVEAPDPATNDAATAEDTAPALTLTVEPDDAALRVEVDGQPLSGPPYRLAAGTHQLELRHPDFRPLSRTLTIDADSPEAMTLRLEPLEDGTLTVLAPAVAWAEVEVDGEPLGTTPLTDKAVREGKHKLEVRCTAAVCGQTRVLLRQTIQIRPGRGKTVEIE